MGLYVPMANPDFWQKIGPKLQETCNQDVGGEHCRPIARIPRSRRRARRECAGEAGRHLRRRAAGRTRRVHADMLKVQDKAVADAHISPKLVELVMADVGA